MKEHLRRYFIPHEGNNFYPHFLHSKRTAFYSLLMLAIKAVVVVFVILLPAEAFLLPDVLKEQQDKIITYTNDVRRQKGLTELTDISTLTVSADTRAKDMADNNYFSHKGPNNHTLAYFLKQSGYSYRVAGENLAMGFSDAQSVVNAWIKSPTHYANLIDSDYTQIGVGIEAGYYNDQPTVFVAQHFGDPSAIVPVSSTPESSTAVAPKKSTSNTQVRGEKIDAITTVPTNTPPVPVVDKSRSRVYWFDHGDTTLLVLRTVIMGTTSRVVAYVNFYPIELSKIGTSTEFGGSLEVQEPSNKLFDPIITPTVTITAENGTQINDSIEWFEPKVVGATPVEKYFEAKRVLSPVTNIFSVTKGIYLVFLALFGVALGINIFVEVRRQHYHVIFQTVVLICFILMLWYF